MYKEFNSKNDHKSVNTLFAVDSWKFMQPELVIFNTSDRKTYLLDNLAKSGNKAETFPVSISFTWLLNL